MCDQDYFYTPGWDTITGITLQAPSCRVANHSTGFNTSCLLTKLAIIIMKTVIKTICLLKVSYLTFAKCFLFSVTFCFLWTSFCFLSFRILCILVKKEFNIDHNKNTNKHVLHDLHVPELQICFRHIMTSICFTIEIWQPSRKTVLAFSCQSIEIWVTKK